MKKKNETEMKTLYKKLATALHLAENVWTNDDIDEAEKRDYVRRYRDLIAMQGILDEGSGEHTQSIRELIDNDQFDTDPKHFFEAYSKLDGGSENLTPYSASDFRHMKTFKVKNFDIGFAIKDSDEIVSVFNASGNSGIGDHLIRAAKRNGGKRLDHVDGFLTDLYRRNNFKITNVYTWDDQYAPDGWAYTPLDITNKKYSIYMGEYNPPGSKLEVGSPQWEKKKQQYQSGRPDIVFRST